MPLLAFPLAQEKDDVREYTWRIVSILLVFPVIFVSFLGIGMT